MEIVRSHLLIAGEQRFALANFQRSRAGAGIDPFHRSRHQFLMLALEFLQHLAAFAVADALADDIPGRQ